MDPFPAFQELLIKLHSTDNEQRKEAETTYENIEMTQKISLLVTAGARADLGQEYRQLALVLLRRLLVNDWEDLSKLWTPEVLTSFKTQILAMIQGEPDEALRRKVCEVAAEIARNTLDENGSQTWPEILNCLFEWANSANDALKEAALVIFESVPGIFGTQQRHYMAVIKDMVSKCLHHPSNPQIRADAVKATTSFLCDNEDDVDVLRFFTDLLSQMLLVCAEQAQTEDGDETVFQCLVELASHVPKIFRSKLADTCTLCLKVMGNSQIDMAFHHSALEVLVELCENAAPMMRKDGHKFIPDVIQQCLKMMVEVDDDDTWGQADTEDDEDEDSEASIGESSLDRLAVALGGKHVLAPCLQLIPAMLHNGDWKYRHAGLMALGAIGEGCHKAMEPILDKVVDTILPYFLDQHSRVRYAACNAVGQMSSDFAPTIQKRFIGKILPNLLQVLDDMENPRVQAHAGAALVNFSEDCPKNLLIPYLQVIMAKLENVLQEKFKELAGGGKKLVLEQIITTIASVADTVEAKFTPYYERVMPCLKFILEHAATPELRLLRGKTIESISLIGLAVGSEKFLTDANDVMQLLVKTQLEFGSEVEDDDPQVSYMISAWARMCKILGKQFEQYLPLVMPAVVKTASLKPEVAILEADEAKTMEEENDWQFVNIGDQQSFGIRTCGLEDKATACQMLVCYARELKEGFAPYVEEVTKLMVPMLKFYFHDGVRVAAAESLPYLLESAQCRGGNFVMEMWQFICPELLKAIEMDPDNDALAEHMYSLAKCIEVLGSGCLSEEHLVELKNLLDKYLTEHFKKAEARKEKRKDEDYDDEVEKELMNEDDEDVFLLSKISDIIHALFGTHKEAILPFFDSLLPLFTQLLDENRSHSDNQWGICVFDDVIEFTGSNSVKYQSVFLPAMQRGLNCESPEVRQAAAYGYGIMAMHGGNPYAQACAAAVPFLVNMISNPEARVNELNTSATENAIAAVAKILKYNSSMVDSAQIIPHWLTWLPTWEDTDESPHIYGYLCDLIEMNHPLVVGDNHSNLPRIVAIIAEAFHKKAVDDCVTTKARLVTLVRQIQAQTDVFQACLTTLNADQIAALQEALNTPS